MYCNRKRYWKQTPIFAALAADFLAPIQGCHRRFDTPAGHSETRHGPPSSGPPDACWSKILNQAIVIIVSRQKKENQMGGTQSRQWYSRRLQELQRCPGHAQL